MVKSDLVKSVLFPVFGSYPNVLNFGQSNKLKSSTKDKKILYVLDGTGSMGEFINELGECSKMVMAKKLIKLVQDSRPDNDYDIVVFNTRPFDACKLDGVPEPNNATYFTPLVPELDRIFKTDHKYFSVVFMSDGLPSEETPVAHEAIRTLGNITRENGVNPVSVAIGSDADGLACSLFAGNRGFNCFIKYNKDLEGIGSDISNGVDCVYEELPNGAFIPVESDNSYYYVSTNPDGDTVKPTRELVEKFLNLVIQKHLSDTSNYSTLRSYVELVVKLLDDETAGKEIVDKYIKLLETVKRVAIQNAGTPGIISATASAYRQVSQQV